MASIALQSAASGLNALSTKLDVVANNLANVNTTGFKSSRANFQDLLYVERQQPGVENANGDQRPIGLHVGLGVQVAGSRLEPRINIPADARTITVGADGRVFVSQPGEPEPQEVGQLELASFINPAGLSQIGENLYTETSASGAPIVGNPSEGHYGRILQGQLESSNVDATFELIELIRTQRAFEMNSQAIRAADETLRAVGQLRQ